MRANEGTVRLGVEDSAYGYFDVIKFHIFIRGCQLGTSVNTILSLCQSNEVNLKRCEVVTGRSLWYQTFKLSVSVPDRNKVLNSSFWYEQVFVGKFHKPKVLVTCS